MDFSKLVSRQALVCLDEETSVAACQAGQKSREAARDEEEGKKKK